MTSSPTCASCAKSPPEVKLKHSVRCPTIKYCGRAPKGLQQGIATPFTRLDKGTWLLNRPQKDVYALLIDAYRLRVVDLYNLRRRRERQSLRWCLKRPWWLPTLPCKCCGPSWPVTTVVGFK
ncbi:uncharacterized protein LMH87_008457 [Akanthomyces muscarius]|uniref:Uncharacterized protein n=1 Tax=Akanthomyces muscarius TaxID=2231603 RepID=A0A9W8QJR0_AKAMU|nr:uncharacterized protein LMH87_008457 [Akanthomyces muscarius]KAJ4159559.1 hypothetical protein LMH87_008457 [Akanthomyces muscarius]